MKNWSRSSGKGRATQILRVADQIDHDRGTFARQEVRTSGKPITASLAETEELAKRRFARVKQSGQGRESSCCGLEDQTARMHMDATRAA